MKRPFALSAATLAATLALAGSALADIYIRAPFVRVRVGDGVRVRAPFVNLYIPSGPPPVYVVPSEEPAPQFVPPQPEALTKPPQSETLTKPPQKTPAKGQPPLPKVKGDASPPLPKIKSTDAPPLPKVKGDDAPPAPAALEPVLTPEQFTRNFQPKAGNYEVTMLNPVNQQATAVRFTLPEGTPRRVRVSGNQIEFDYGPRQYVRIRFDSDGAEVISR